MNGHAVEKDRFVLDIYAREPAMTQSRPITHGRARRRLGDTHSVIVLFLSVVLTLVAIYDLFLLTAIAQ